jgi:hypothetical protein
MLRKTLFAWPVVCALGMLGCAETPQTMLSPSAVSSTATFVNADGSTMKVSAPSNLLPSSGIVTDSRRPRLSFTNAAGVFTPVGLAYEVEMQDGAGTVVYHRVIGESAGSSAHEVDNDLEYSRTYWWRVRARLDNQTGPWSGFAEFRTLDPPAPPRPTASNLPFVVPAPCLAGDGPGCVVAMTAASPWWAACTGGSGTNCHRFTRSVAAALAVNDPGWGLLSKNFGEWQCTWNACGNLGGQGYGEDVVTHFDGATLRGWDIVVGAGLPGAHPSWARLEQLRAGNNWAPIPPLGTN